MNDPDLSGRLDIFPLSDILLMINSNRKTGALHCRASGVTKTVEWEKGEIVFARSSAPEDRLGNYLLARGLVTSEQLKRADPMVGSQTRLGKSLVRLRVLTPTKLWEAVRGQVTEIVYSLFHWEEGNFEFLEGNPPTEKISIETTVINIIMEGTRRLDEWTQVKEKIPNDQVVLTRAKSLEEIARSVHLAELEDTVFKLVDGRRTVREVVDRSREGEFEIWQALYSLLSAGVIRPQVLTFQTQATTEKKEESSEIDAKLERTLSRYGKLVEDLFARVSAKEGPKEVDRLRKLIRLANFEKADLFREVAIEPSGKIDHGVLMANVAEYPPGERIRATEAALEHLLRMLTDELKGKVDLEDLTPEGGSENS